MIDRDAEHNDRMVDLLSGRNQTAEPPLVQPAPPWPFPTHEVIYNRSWERFYADLVTRVFYQALVIPGEVRCWWKHE